MCQCVWGGDGGGGWGVGGVRLRDAGRSISSGRLFAPEDKAVAIAGTLIGGAVKRLKKA